MIPARLALAVLLTVVGSPLAQGAEEGELNVGDKSPAFSLEGSDGKTHTLDDHVGVRPVVMAWFPKAFTSG